MTDKHSTHNLQWIHTGLQTDCTLPKTFYRRNTHEFNETGPVRNCDGDCLLSLLDFDPITMLK